MIDKIEEVYLEEMSILEKYRGRIVVAFLTIGMLIPISSVLHWFCLLKVLISALVMSLGVCVVIRIRDFLKIIKQQPKNKIVYSVREYQRAKFTKIKNSIQKVLESEECNNSQNIDTLMDKYRMKYRSNKDESIENYKWIASIIISFIGLKDIEQAMVVMIIIPIVVIVVLKKVFDIAFDYLLTSKIDNNLMYDVLVEIKLDVIKKEYHDSKNKNRVQNFSDEKNQIANADKNNTKTNKNKKRT